MSNVAVEGCVLQPVPPATGTITILPNQASQEVFVNNKGVYFKEIKFTVAGSNGGGSVTDNNGTGSGSIIATGSDMQEVATGSFAVLEGDESAEVLISGTASDEPATGSIKVRVVSAGQTDASLT